MSSNKKELLSAISAATQAKKRNTDERGDGLDLLGVYHTAGKKAAALLDPFGIPSQAFLVGIQHDGADESTSEADISPEATRHLHFYHGLLKLIPGLKAKLNTISSKELKIIINQISKGMSDIRSADLSSVKHKGLKYIPQNMLSKSDALDPPIPEVTDKSMRGIFHPQLARFLCPARKLDKFDEDPVLGMQLLQAGEIQMIASKWPAGFYQEGVYNPRDKTKGLFRNHVIARFYQHLFVGPSAVMTDSDAKKGSKPSKNRAWGLQGVDEYVIAYVHIITYITLSHASQWTQVISNMDLQDLFWRIVEMFEDKRDPWVKDTLSWWKRLSVPASKKGTCHHDDSSDDDMAEIRARRAARAKQGREASELQTHDEATDPDTMEGTAFRDNPGANDYEEVEYHDDGEYDYRAIEDGDYGYFEDENRDERLGVDDDDQGNDQDDMNDYVATRPTMHEQQVPPRFKVSTIKDTSAIHDLQTPERVNRVGPMATALDGKRNGKVNGKANSSRNKPLEQDQPPARAKDGFGSALYNSRKEEQINQVNRITTSRGKRNVNRSSDVVAPSTKPLDKREDQPMTRVKDTRVKHRQGEKSVSESSGTATSGGKQSVQRPVNVTHGSLDGSALDHAQPPSLKVRLKLPANMVRPVTPQETLLPPESAMGGKGRKRVAELQEIDNNTISEAAQDDDGARPLKKGKKMLQQENSAVVKRSSTRQKRANGF